MKSLFDILYANPFEVGCRLKRIGTEPGMYITILKEEEYDVKVKYTPCGTEMGWNKNDLLNIGYKPYYEIVIEETT